MRRRLAFILLAILSVPLFDAISARAGEDVPPPRPLEVQLGPEYIIMPIGRILLLRRDQEYCAVKFLRFWNGEAAEERYAEYDAYEPPKGTGSFDDKRTETFRRQASSTRPQGIGFLSFNKGNREIRCGSFRLPWSGAGTVHFEERGKKESGPEIELAPTYWKDVSKVNTGDFRVIWYAHDDRREKINVPIGDFALQ